MSFDVQSMRYVNFDDSEPVFPEEFDVRGEALLELQYDKAAETYDELLDNGAECEDARFALPLATEVNLSFSANSRALMHFIDMRHAGDAQWEIRHLAERVLEECKEWAPTTFEVYEEHAKGASKKAP
jgi:Predicted alternative thymidylate synthase